MSYKCFKFSFILILLVEIFFTFRAEAQIPKGQNLLSDGINSLTPYGINSPERFIKKVEVKGENFSEAFNINTLNEETFKGDIGLSAGITTALKKGDVLWISFKSRFNSNDDDFKARYLGDFMTAVFSHPATTGFVQWGFWEGQHWFPVAALWNKDWTIRKHRKVFTDLVSKTWWTNFEGITSDNGTVKFRRFCGDYNIRIKYKGQTVQQKYSLSNNGGEVIIKTNQ